MIGDEARSQALEAEGDLPERVIACVGGGSNSIGTFYAFLDDPVELIGVEAAGEGIESGRHGASLSAGSTGVLHGALSAVLADEQGQILEAHSVSAGLDYPGVGPEHAFLRDSGRATYVSVTDTEAVLAFRELARLEGIIPALEPSHAIAWLLADAGERRPATGRGLRPALSPGAATRTWTRRPRSSRRSMAEVATADRIADAFAGRARAGPRGADALHDGRLPRCGHLAARRARLRRRRRRPDRAGHPVLRPARRRAGDPRRGHGCARGRGDARDGAGGVRRGRGGASRSSRWATRT